MVLPSSWALFCVFFLLAAIGCAGIFFNASDYPTWVSTVMLFRNTSILTTSGCLQLNSYTNATVGRALYKTAFQMHDSANGSLSSFNTSFVFSIDRVAHSDYYGDGFAFLFCPIPFRSDGVSSGGYLGMFNSGNIGLLSNKVFAIEFDTHRNTPYRDPNDNHIGVDLNSVISLRTNNLTTLGIVLNGGQEIVCWVDYDGLRRYLWVYLALSPSAKPSSPAISMALDLAPYVNDYMYVGFSSATGSRAEVHTIHSWWFLAGFGSPTFPSGTGNHSSTSARPLAKLGQRKVAVGVISLAALVVFLCLLSICACCWWRKHSKHLIDILLPVACWIYWKESTPFEMRSTRCLKLATPVVELLAWLWRTRSARKLEELHAVTWWEVLLNGKMGRYHKAVLWHLEDAGWKRRKRLGVFHVDVCESFSDGDSHGENSSFKKKVQTIKHMKISLNDGDLEQVEKTPLATMGRQQWQDEGRAAAANFHLGTNLFVSLDEKEVDLFHRRGSFLIPQGAPVVREEIKRDVNSFIPCVTKAEFSSPEPEIERLSLQAKDGVVYTSIGCSSQGSLFPHTDETNLIGSAAIAEKDIARMHKSAVDSTGNDHMQRKIDVPSLQGSSLQKFASLLTNKTEAARLHLSPRITYVSKDAPHDCKLKRRGAFLMLSGDAVKRMDSTSDFESVIKPPVCNTIEDTTERNSDPDSIRTHKLRRGSFMLPRTEQESELVNGPFMQHAIERHNGSSSDRVHGFEMESFMLSSVEPDIGTMDGPPMQCTIEGDSDLNIRSVHRLRGESLKLPRIRHEFETGNETSVQNISESESNPNMTRLNGARRGAFMMPRVEHDLGTVNGPLSRFTIECGSYPDSTTVHGLKRGSLLLPSVEHDIGTVDEPSVMYNSDPKCGRVDELRRGHFILPGVENGVATHSMEENIRRGSFILVNEASASYNPRVEDQACGSVPQQLISGIEHEHKGDVVRRLDVRRGSFILVEAAASPSQPEAREHAEPPGGIADNVGLQESSSDSSKPS